jgi:hypothetical protein
MLESAIALIGLVFGLLIGRRWATLLAIPFGILFGTRDWGGVLEDPNGGPYWVSARSQACFLPGESQREFSCAKDAFPTQAPAWRRLTPRYSVAPKQALRPATGV